MNKDKDKYAKLQAFGERLLSLLVIFLMLSAAVAATTGQLWGHRLNSIMAKDSGTKSETVALPSPAQLAAIGLNNPKLKQRDSVFTAVSSPSGEPLGMLVSSRKIAKGIKGFAGPTPLWVYIDNDGIVRGVITGENAETGSFFAHATEGGLLTHWNGLSAETAANTEVDAVSGATFSSTSVIRNVQAALKAYTKQSLLPFPEMGWAKPVAIAIVLALGVVASFIKYKNKYLRLGILALNVIVLGFWSGQFVSVSLLLSWISNGISIPGSIPTLSILAVAVLMAFFGHSGHYCNWVCPYGSLQALAYSLPVPKVKVKPHTFKVLATVRQYFLMVLLFFLWFGVGAEILDYEPFSAFLLSGASTAVLVLASLFVVLGIFVPSPWCKTLCPLGELFKLSQESK